LLVAVLATATGAARGAHAQSATKNFVMHQQAKPLGSVGFADEQGRALDLNTFKGKIVVLNIWATWCVPCRTEMPTLDRLEAALGGANLEVVPVSIDRGGIDVVKTFFNEIGIQHLATYVDSSGQVLRGVGAIGLPTTLIVDRAGNEAGRVVGPVEWDAPEVVELLKSLVAKPESG
jgi:thiol-disulfide isomerase/thioredoxin